MLQGGESECLSSVHTFSTGYKCLVNPHSFHRGWNRPACPESSNGTSQIHSVGRPTAPQVSVNMHSWATESQRSRPWLWSSRPEFMAGFTVYSPRRRRLQLEGHCSMISLRFSCRMVSLTAWKTKRMFSVSTAVVKWWKSGFPRFLLFRLNDCTRNAWKEQSKDTQWTTFRMPFSSNWIS